MSGVSVEKVMDPAIGWKNWLTVLLLGYPAYIVVTDAGKIPSIFGIIGQQSMGAIYIFEKRFDRAFFGKNQSNFPWEFLDAIDTSESHVCYVVDEDSSISENNVTEIIAFGAKCPRSMLEAVGIS
jgi:hypothetical protein